MPFVCYLKLGEKSTKYAQSLKEFLKMLKTRMRIEEKEHDKLIVKMIGHFQGLGYSNIKADLQGYTRPAAVYWNGKTFIADITCKKNNSRGTPILLEGETASTIDHQHTSNQWMAFHSEARRLLGEFHIVVPSGCREAARKRLRVLGITADEIWTAKV